MTSAHRLIGATLLIALLLPLFALSQASSPICTIERKTYKHGDSGSGVVVIQSFLKDRGFFDRNPTGYFGPLTELALIRFQLSTGIISDAAEGGVFGKRTWNYVVANFCTQSTTLPPTNQCPAPPAQPTNLSCAGNWRKIFNAQECHVGWSCITYASTTTTQANHPPIITAIIGPSSVAVGSSSTWTIQATDPDHDTLTYSVIWGDEGANVSGILDLAGQGTDYSSPNAFSHTYKTAGGYTFIAYVKDAAGNINKATLSVLAVAPLPPNPAGNQIIPTNTNAGVSCNSASLSEGQTIPNPSCSAGSLPPDAAAAEAICSGKTGGEHKVCIAETMKYVPPAPCPYIYLMCVKGQMTPSNSISAAAAAIGDFGITADVIDSATTPETGVTNYVVEFTIPLTLINQLYAGAQYQFIAGNGSGGWTLNETTCPGMGTGIGSHFEQWGGTGGYYAVVDGSSTCKFRMTYTGRGVYIARLVDPRNSCGTGAVECPGGIYGRVHVYLR